jgi:trehalose 6-phosphate phosphatase
MLARLSNDVHHARYIFHGSRYLCRMPALPALDVTEPVAVFLDFDGTLVDIAERPDLVSVPAALLTTMQDVHDRLNGALALVSGRSIADLDALLAPLQLPMAGVHGSEHRDQTGHLSSVDSSSIPASVRRRMTALAESDPGLILEDKGSSLALHYRQSPARESLIRTELNTIFENLGQDFVLLDGKMVVEIRPNGVNKGTAVEKFLTNPPFTGRRPIFIGDDITDEDAFRVVNRLKGYSVKVGSRSQHSAALYELEDVNAVRDWLEPLAHQNSGHDTV